MMIKRRALRKCAKEKSLFLFNVQRMLTKTRAILTQLKFLSARLTTNDVVVIASFFANKVDGFRLFLTFPCHYCYPLCIVLQTPPRRHVYLPIWSRDFVNAPRAVIVIIFNFLSIYQRFFSYFLDAYLSKIRLFYVNNVIHIELKRN